VSWKRLTLWPNGLASQIVALVILALIVAQGLTGVLAVVLQPHRQMLPHPMETVSRVAAMLEALDAAAPAQRPQIAQAFHGAGMEVTLQESGALAPAPPGTGETSMFSDMVASALTHKLPLSVTEKAPANGRLQPLVLTAALGDGMLVAIDTAILAPPRFFEFGFGPFLFYLPFLALTMTLLTVWATRRVTAPLRAFADAAERLGNERAGPPLPERGPVELRRAAQTFNKMQEQLKRFVDDRTRLLASISHDLRTPITRLRLRIEAVVDEGDEQQKMLQDLQQMDAMVGAALSFLRDATQEEKVELVDLASLLQSVCDEFADVGRAANYVGPASLDLRCRPRMLGRAMTNLVENAIKFGGVATVGLAAAHGAVFVYIDDQGPGIPDAEKERAFDPFYRLDPARNPDSGSVGLGLSIAQTIVQAHGGNIALRDRAPRGLRVTVSLPTLGHGPHNAV